MKAYTLRINEDVLKKLKYISLEEKKNIREILLELIDTKIYRYKLPFSKKNPEEEAAEVKKILNKLSDKKVLASIRQDRKR